MSFDELKKRMIQGINTFYNNSVATHVFLPEGIAISLGFKFYNTFQVIREVLIGRFGEQEEHLKPGIRSYDGTYTEFVLSCAAHEIKVQSTAIDGDLLILITPLITCPMPPALVVSAAVLWNKPGYATIEKDRLLISTPGKDIEVFTDGIRQRQLNTGITNPYIAVELSRVTAVSTGKPVSARELVELMEKQRQKILGETTIYGDMAECYNAMRSCLAWNTIYEPEKEQICSPVSRLWSLFRGGYALFDWDTYFSALMAMVDNKDLAYANAIAITHEKTEDGFIPNLGGADNNKTRDRSQPPVGSLVVREIYRRFRERWFVEYLFDDLLVWNRWFAANRRLKNGWFCWGSKPYKDAADRPMRVQQMGTAFGASLESGLDNSPMYDNVPFNSTTCLMELADVGLTGLYILDCECLAELADLLGRSEARELRERAELSKNGLEELWDEKTGLYLNRRTDTMEPSMRISPTNFYALFSDRVSKERTERILKEHFFNSEEFYGEYIIPSVPRNDPAYKDQNYWRGRIWAPFNYLVYIALKRQDQDEACKILAKKSMNLLLKEWLAQGHVHENYNGDTGEGCDVKNSDKFYHWGGLLALISLIEAGFVDNPAKPL
jgi:hypothetical protein